MSISLGVYNIVLIFFFIIIPGYLLRRFYYQGEFSKQLYSYNGQIPNLIYSFITGLFFTLIYVFIINLVQANTIDVEEILINFDNLIEKDVTTEINEISNIKASEKFLGLYSKLYNTYLPYLFSIYLFTIFIGVISSKLVIYFNLDSVFKLLRFKNSWHYLFTGRILKQYKFKNSISKDLKIEYNYIDVLVDNKTEKPQLYSGLYVDYSLNPNDPCKLEKLHLTKTIRYSKKNNDTEKKEIPGEIFTILGENILNINCNYVFKKIEKKKYLKSLLLLGQIFTISTFVITSIILLIEINLFDSSFLEKSFKYSFFKKILLLLMLNISLGILTPFDIKKEKIEFIGFKAFILKFVLFAILFFIIYKNWIFSLF